MMWIAEQGKWENLGILEICVLAKGANSHILDIGKMKGGLAAIRQMNPKFSIWACDIRDMSSGFWAPSGFAQPSPIDI